MSDPLREAFAKHRPTLEAELSLGESNPNFRGLADLTARHAWGHFQAGYLAADARAALAAPTEAAPKGQP